MPASPLRASAIVIGDEILGGYVRDTNSGWLASRLQQHGVPLERVVTVPDDRAAISEALGAELGRARPRVIVTSGGIGTTPDDLTLEAVARHVGVELVVEPHIDAHITALLERIAARGIAVDGAHEVAMRKMALVPAGTYLLGGSADGMAPGVALDVDGGCGADTGATLVLLPGIPSEFQRITTAHVEARLLAGRGEPTHVVELTHPYPESAINGVLQQVTAAYPDVHVGSYPGYECTIRLKGPQPRVEDAAALVREAIARLHATPGAEAMRTAWQRHWAPGAG